MGSKPATKTKATGQPRAARPAAPTPERTCLGGGGTQPQDALLRFVAGPDGLVHLDLTGKLPGRGAYVTPTPECLQEAIKRKALSRALEAQTPPDLLAQVIQLYQHRLTGLLGLLLKGGQLVTGADLVAEALHKGHIEGVVYACDIAAGSLAKLQQQARAADVPCLPGCEKSALSIALNKENCAIVAVRKPHFAGNLRRVVTFYDRLRGLPETDTRLDMHRNQKN